MNWSGPGDGCSGVAGAADEIAVHTVRMLVMLARTLRTIMFANFCFAEHETFSSRMFVGKISSDFSNNLLLIFHK